MLILIGKFYRTSLSQFLIRGTLLDALARILIRINVPVADVFGVSRDFEVLVEERGASGIWEIPDKAIELIAQKRHYTSGGKGGRADVTRTCRMIIKAYIVGNIFSFSEVCPESDLEEWLTLEAKKWIKQRRALNVSSVNLDCPQ